MSRVLALLEKEFADLRRHPGIFLPGVLTAAISIVLPFFVAVIVPAWTGERLSDSADFQIALEMYRSQPITQGMDPEAAVQAWVFQQFLPLLVLAPVAASMSVAAYTVIGEKQARTLEPLLATPMTTYELLTAKVVGALAPTLAISLAGLAIYFAGILLFAAPGVAASMASARTFALILLVAPAAALVSLQAAILISSRVNDARTAQQFGVLIILPLTGILVAQFTGTIWLSAGTLALVGIGLLAFWILLTVISVALFDRESILTRWR